MTTYYTNEGTLRNYYTHVYTLIIHKKRDCVNDTSYTNIHTKNKRNLIWYDKQSGKFTTENLHGKVDDNLLHLSKSAPDGSGQTTSKKSTQK